MHGVVLSHKSVRRTAPSLAVRSFLLAHQTANPTHAIRKNNNLSVLCCCDTAVRAMTLQHRAVEEMYSKGWQGSRAAYLSMIAVMGKRHDYDGVLYVSLHYALAFGHKIVDHCCHELQMTSHPFLASFRPPLNGTPGLYIGCFNKHKYNVMLRLF